MGVSFLMAATYIVLQCLTVHRDQRSEASRYFAKSVNMTNDRGAIIGPTQLLEILHRFLFPDY